MHTEVGMVKPGGTGRPRLAISARLAPLPPSKSRNPALPSALPSPKVNTHLPDFTASTAGLPAVTLLTGLAAAALRTGFGAGLGGLFLIAWRALAGGGALARAGVDGFDFAGIFLVFATALAMTANNPQEMKRCAPYTTFGRFRARCEAYPEAYMWNILNRPSPAKPMKIR